MNVLQIAVDFILHLDVHLQTIVADYGLWTHGLLFAIIFVETGLVIMPFLPGDSLLFAAGTLAALGSLHLGWLLAALVAAAVIGDTVNYWVGHRVGPQAFDGRVRFLNRSHLHRTHLFFERHGGKAIVLARFVPIVRTFAPFVAGVGNMRYGRFLAYNALGGVLWVTLMLLAGYFFGSIPIVRQNFAVVIPAIILLSLVPVLVEMVQERRRLRQAAALPGSVQEQQQTYVQP